MPVKILQGKTALITGGGSGIGFAIAQRLAAQGCAIALVDANRERLAAAGRILESTGQTVTTHELDVSDESGVRALGEEFARRERGLNILVNSAGVSLAGRFTETTLADMRWVLDVNFWGTVYCCKFLLPALKCESEAQIVNICSSFGWLGWAGKTAYSASKFAVRGFSEALRMELSGSSVGLTVVYPGPVATNIVADGRVANEQQRRAELEFLSRRAIPAERVAKRVVDSIRKNPARVRLSADYLLMDWLARIAPGGAQAMGARIARKLPF